MRLKRTNAMTQRIPNSRAVVALMTAFLSAAAHGHHSAVAFDRDSTRTLSGTVSRLVWRNPHVAIELDVTADDGSVRTWKIEGNQPSSWRSLGITRDMLKAGEAVTIVVNPLRSGMPGGQFAGLTLADGRTFGAGGYDGEGAAEESRGERMVLERKLPSLTEYEPPPAGETWQTREARRRPTELPIPQGRFNTGYQAGALDPENLARPRPAAPFDLTGTWEFRAELEEQASYGLYEFKPLPKLTAKAQATFDEYLEYAREGKRYLEPTAQCYPVGMPRYMTRYGSIMMLQYPTAIYMISRLNNEFRVVYLDGRERMPRDQWEPNWNGESIGRWEGDTLVIETTGFTDENHLIQQGIFTGDQLTITERITMLNGGNTLKIDFTMTDPEHWEGEWRHTKFRDRTLNYDVREATCLNIDNAALPGEARRD